MDEDALLLATYKTIALQTEGHTEVVEEAYRAMVEQACLVQLLRHREVSVKLRRKQGLLERLEEKWPKALEPVRVTV